MSAQDMEEVFQARVDDERMAFRSSYWYCQLLRRKADD